MIKMKSLAFAVFAVLLAYSFALPSVLKFEIEKEDQHRSVKLQNYQFKNCLPTSNETGVVNSLEFKPDPLVFPGPLNVSFDVDFKAQVGSPLKGSLYLGKKVGSVWIKVPCIGSIGSCTYDDICQFLSGISDCPDPSCLPGSLQLSLQAGNGNYKLPVASFAVESALFPPGDYHLQANLTMNTVIVGCYEIFATFG